MINLFAYINFSLSLSTYIHAYIHTGLYSLYLEKWLEYFPLKQFLVTRLEDYDVDPQAYLSRIYSFLDLRTPSDDEWTKIIHRKYANVNHIEKDTLLPETDKILRAFYQPYNDILAKLLNEDKYQWLDGEHLNFLKMQRKHLKNVEFERMTELNEAKDLKLQMQQRIDRGLPDFQPEDDDETGSVDFVE